LLKIKTNYATKIDAQFSERQSTAAFFSYSQLEQVKSPVVDELIMFVKADGAGEP